ncbi:MAG: PorP/SprF family type IX secretion system membrane protein [Bacteroidia bacterium]
MKNIAALVILLSVYRSGMAQDIHFSQYSEAPIAINPALIGASYDTRAIIGYRTQWGSVAKAYQTYGVTFEQALKHLKLKKSYISVGANIYSDKAGDAKLGSIMPNVGISYSTRTSRYAKFSGGLQAGVVYRTIDVSALRWDSQYTGYEYNPSLPSGEVTPRSSIVSFDMGAGVNYHYAKSERYISAQDGGKVDIGFSVFHFGIPKNSFITTNEQLYTKYIGFINADIGIKSAGIGLVPSVLYMRQGPSEEIMPGFMFKYIIQDQATYTKLKKASAISFGAYYRVKDAIIPSLLMQYDKWAVGVAYDLNFSQLTPASRLKGGLEITLRWNTSPGYGRALGGSSGRPTN